MTHNRYSSFHDANGIALAYRPSINPRVDLSHLSNSGSLPVITAVARVSNPTGLSRGYGGNMAHATYRYASPASTHTLSGGL